MPKRVYVISYAKWDNDWEMLYGYEIIEASNVYDALDKCTTFNVIGVYSEPLDDNSKDDR